MRTFLVKETQIQEMKSDEKQINGIKKQLVITNLVQLPELISNF